MKRLVKLLHIMAIVFATATAMPGFGQTRDSVSTATPSYVPEIHGVVRARWEMATENGDSHFQVRNARLQVLGYVGPVFSYYINTDFCDRGKIKILDAWGRANVGHGLAVQAGQFRQPFGMDSFRGPASYLFGNRSFIGRYMCNVRSVGVQLQYSLPKVPILVEGGIFNPTDISDHSGWTHTYAYAGKATWTDNGIKITGGFQSLIPDSVRINLWDIGASYNIGRLSLEAEYMYKHYTNSAHRPCHGYLATVNYAVPIRKSKAFNSISFQGRFDGMTAHSAGTRSDGKLVTEEPGRRRLTLGTTLSGTYSKRLHADLRLNYEKYFYDSGSTHLPEFGDRILLEMVVSF